MTVLYISTPPFFDLDLSLIKHLSEHCEVTYLLDLPLCFHKSSAIHIKQPYLESGIFQSNIYPEFSEWYDFIKPEQFYVINRTSSKVYSKSNIRLQKTLYDFVKKFNPDVIHLSNFFNLSYLYFILRNQFKIVLTVHDPIPHTGENTRRKSFERNLNFCFIKNIILLNRLQSALFEGINKQYKFKNIFLSSLGVYEYLTKYRTKDCQLPPDNQCVFLFFGRISPYKGVDLLLQAFTEITSKYNNIKLIIAGNGKYWFDKSGYEQNPKIEIINQYIPNSELVQLIEKSNIVVCPYKDATQSGVVMSAFALSKSVLATNTGGLSDMVEDGKTGYIIEPNNVNALCKKMIYIFENQSELKIFEQNIQNDFISGCHSWDKICEQLVKYYENIRNSI